MKTADSQLNQPGSSRIGPNDYKLLSAALDLSNWHYRLRQVHDLQNGFGNARPDAPSLILKSRAGHVAHAQERVLVLVPCPVLWRDFAPRAALGSYD